MYLQLCVVAFVSFLIAYFVKRCKAKAGSAPLPRKYYICITGCDSGIGKVLAQHLADGRTHVFAACLHDAHEGCWQGGHNITRIRMDVTDPVSVDDAFQLIAKRLDETKGELWALVNNAGVLVYGEYEWQTWKQVESQVGVNLLGMMRVTRAALPLLRRSGGRLINVSSVNGQHPFPGISVYTATKFAVEGFSHSLRNELSKFGIKDAIGDFVKVTNIMERHEENINEMWNSMSEEAKCFYAPYFHGYQDAVTKNAGMTSFLNFHDSPLFRDFEHALFSSRPRISYTSAPLLFRFIYFFLKLLPYAVVDAVWSSLQKKTLIRQ